MLKKIYHNFIRKLPRLSSFILALLLFTKLKFLEKKKNKKKRILLISKERFNDDLKIINLSPEIEFVYFEKKDLSILTEPYLTDLRPKMKSTFWIDYKNEKFFNDYLENHSLFMFFFLQYLDNLINFDAIATTSLWYFPDKAIEKASFKLNKKFFILHKENSYDERDFGRVLKIYSQQIIKFEDNCYVSIYNELMRKLIVETKSINPLNVICNGCPRTDQLVNLSKLNVYKEINQNKSIIFASFPYNLGAYIMDEQQNLKREKNQFETNDGEIIDFFNEVHLEFIDIAAKNKNYNFIIKLKYENLWKHLIVKLIDQKEKELGFKISNLIIISTETSMAKLLPESRLLIGLNSLTLVEAKIFGLPVITPIFKKVQKYEKFFNFTKYYNHVIQVSRSIEEFRFHIESNLKTEIKRDISRNASNFINDSFGYSDGKNTERCIKFILN